MAVGFIADPDEATVPKSASIMHNNNQSQPLPGDTAPTHLEYQTPTDLDDLSVVITTLRMRNLMQQIIVNLIAHVMLFGGLGSPEHALCPDCVLLVLLFRYYI